MALLAKIADQVINLSAIRNAYWVGRTRYVIALDAGSATFENEQASQAEADLLNYASLGSRTQEKAS